MALAADRNLTEKDGRLQAMKQGVNTVFKNALVMLAVDGYLKPAVSGAGNQFAGIAYEGSINAGAAGDKSPRVEMTGTWILPGTGFTQAMVGEKVFAVDDATVTTTEGTGSKLVVGFIVGFISATEVEVKITPFAGTGAA